MVLCLINQFSAGFGEVRLQGEREKLSEEKAQPRKVTKFTSVTISGLSPGVFPENVVR